MLYTVISPKVEYYKLYEDFIKSYTEVKIELCIKEYGKNGDHPHLNIIWDKDHDIRTDKFTAKLKRHMKDLPDIEQPVLIRTQKITSYQNLIGGYLQKENNFEVLIDSKTFDIDKLKTEKKESFKLAIKWNGIMSYTDAPLHVLKYCEDNQIDYVEDYCTMNGTLISKESGGTKLLLGRISKQHFISVAHLMRKSEEIHLQLLFLLVDNFNKIDI